METKKIAFDKIMVDETQIRKDFNNYEFTSLTNSIVKDGLIEPLKVYKESSKYRLLDGERRFRAIQILIKNDKSFNREIDCIILPKPSNNTILQLITDIHKQKISPIEEANAFKKLLEKDKLSIDEIAMRLGIERKRIIDKLKLLTYDKSIQKEINEGKININLAQDIDLNKFKNKPSLLRRLKGVGSNVQMAKEIIAQEYKNTNHLLVILERRIRVLREETYRIEETITRIENSGIKISNISDFTKNILETIRKIDNELLELSKIEKRVNETY